MTIYIRNSIPDDIYGIRLVQKKAWLATYPNEKEGISVSDIEDVFRNDDTPEGKKNIEERKKRYEKEGVQTWVAQDDEKIIGFCIAEKEEEKNRIQAIYVLPEYQRNGIGKQLMEKALVWCRNDRDIFVHVVRYNTKAIVFYKKIGFTETGKVGTFDSVATLSCGKTLPEVELRLVR